MRKRDRQALGKYLRVLADLMELRDWRFDVDRDPPVDNAYASCEPIFGQRFAVLRFAAGFRERSRHDQRHTCVHELLHCHTAGLHSLAVVDLEEVLGSAADTVFCNGMRRQLEYTVDALTFALARHLPLPEWPT